MKFVPVLLAGAACVAAAAARTRAADWPMHRHDAQRTGRSTSSLDPRELRRVWDAPYVTAAIIGDQVFAVRSIPGSVGGTELTSRRLVDGAANWTSVVPQFARKSDIAYADDTLLYIARRQATGEQRLHVHDAADGALRYTVPLEGPDSADFDRAILHRHPQSGQLIAYVTSFQDIKAYRIGAGSATLAWRRPVSVGPGAPALVGGSVVMASPGHYYAFDQLTGAENLFHDGNVTSGSPPSVAYDAARGRIYVSGWFDSGSSGLTAFAYTGNDDIEQLWHMPGGAGAPAIGADGKLYLRLSLNDIAERDPETGQVLRTFTSAVQQFEGDPVLADGYLWSPSSGGYRALSLATTQLVHVVTGSGGPVMMSDEHVVVLGTHQLNGPSIFVYAIPEPACAAGVAVAALALRRPSGRRRR